MNQYKVLVLSITDLQYTSQKINELADEGYKIEKVVPLLNNLLFFVFYKEPWYLTINWNNDPGNTNFMKG